MERENEGKPGSDVRFALILDDGIERNDDDSHPSSIPDIPSTLPNSLSRARNPTSISIHSCPTSLGMESSFPKLEDEKATAKSRKVRRYYKKQMALVNNYKEDTETVELFEKRAHSQTDGYPMEVQIVEEGLPTDIAEESLKRKTDILAKFTIAVNVLLLIIKTIAVILSGSLAIISSVVDSAVDITSGLVIWMTTRAIQNRDPYMYPRGRTRLEPLALVIISVVMAVASVQMIIQSIEAIVHGKHKPDVDLITVLIMVITVCIKVTLAVACYCYRTVPSIAVLGQDHRNDCISNTVAILCAYLADQFWTYLDPIGAILVSLYIAATWFYTGYGQIAILSGRSAEPEFINRIIKICLEHDERIILLDTVYVYHFGTKFLVEVHIVMDGTLSLMEAHDLSEPLQMKLECLNYVERAFVHVDYNTAHRPEDEHKVV